MEITSLLFTGFIITLISYIITTRFICGITDFVVMADKYKGENIFVYEWNGLYYAESWIKGKKFSIIRYRTRFTMTKDKALSLAMIDIETAHASTWHE